MPSGFVPFKQMFLIYCISGLYDDFLSGELDEDAAECAREDGEHLLSDFFLGMTFRWFC